MKKILVTTDFSGNSKAGIRFALQLASQTNATLVFYHVIEIMKPTAWTDRKYVQFTSEKVAENINNMRKFVNALISDPIGTSPKMEFIAETGTDVNKMIIRQSVKQRVDLICMSTRGAGGMAKLMGTISSSLITTSHKPVVVVPKRYKVRPVRKIFFACDMANLGPEVKLVKSLADQLNASAELYHYDYLLHVQENKEKLERKLEKHITENFSVKLKRREIEHTLAFDLQGDISKSKAGLAVMFTRPNRDWLDRLLLSGESTEMSFHSSVPLMVFRKKKS